MGTNFNNFRWLRNREIGLVSNNCHRNVIMNEMYRTFWPINNFQPILEEDDYHGGIFNLEFSPDGSLLAAASEKRNILLFDPIAQKFLHNIEKAHADCVNCVKFLNERTFASCSDDNTIMIWDTRNLNENVRILNGHSNWVKNIEYSSSSGLLVTSGFDGSVYTWDINAYSEERSPCNKVFDTKGLMRMKLTPDGTKMIICTTNGYMIVVHDLNLETMPEDLNDFKLGIYRFMHANDESMPTTARRTFLFDRKRTHNRLEFIVDFPHNDNAQVISSLQVHPEGWCVLSRNLNAEETSEWTCVHTIEDYPAKSDDQFQNWFYDGKQLKTLGYYAKREDENAAVERNIDDITQIKMDKCVVNPNHGGSSWIDDELPQVLYHGGRSPFILGRTDRIRVLRFLNNREKLIRELLGTLKPPLNTFVVGSEDIVISSAKVWEADNSGTTLRCESPKLSTFDNSTDDSLKQSFYSTQYIFASVPPRPTHSGERRVVKDNYILYKNKPRLTDYIEEVQAGKGFIKELCFSPDGRIICSPFMFGIRLLKCPTSHERRTEFGYSPEQQSVASLEEVCVRTPHKDIVVSTKFAPYRCLLVSGCLSGEINWYQPVL